MSKVVIKDKQDSTTKAELPKVSNEIFKLKINPETQKFYIEEQDSYGEFEEVTIRPLEFYNKIKAYDEDFKVKSESILYQQLKDAYDSRGRAASDNEGVVCGRIVWKSKTKDLSEDEKEENKSKAKFYCFIFGVASIKGKEPILIDFQTGGATFMDVIQLVEKIKKEKGDLYKGEIRIKANHNDEFDWPSLEFMPEFSRDLPIEGLEPFFDTIEAYVQQHNERIDKKIEEFNNPKKKPFVKKSSFKKKG